MCHDFDFEMLRRAYAEEMARRQRQRAEAEKKPTTQPAGKPAEPVTKVERKEPIPA